MLNQMEIDCFLSLAETLSFTETARQLFISQQAVSRNIARLEQDLGFDLFVRTKHYVKMTRAGQMYFDLFARLKSELDRTNEEVTRLYRDLGMHIHIAYLDWLDITSQINHAVRRLRDEVPGLQFSAERQRQEKLNALMAEQKVDGVITYESFVKDLHSWKARPLLETEYVLLAGGGIAGQAGRLEYQDFMHETYIKPQEIDETEAEIKEKARQDCRKFGLVPRLIRTAPNIETAYTLAEMGEGVLISTALSRMATDGKLRAYPTGQTEKLICLWNGDENNRLFLRFMDCLEAAFLGTI